MTLGSTITMAQSAGTFQHIREAARHARSGAIEDTDGYSRAIVDSVVPDGPVKDSIRSRLTELQHCHRQGLIQPVTEEKLVKAVNKLADQMGMPEYGKTSTLELRLLRVEVSRVMPEITEEAFQNPDHWVGPNNKEMATMSTKMTPAEITYLLGLLIRQKLLNPSFQLTEAELRTRYTKAKQTSKPINASSGPHTFLSIELSDKGKNIRNSLGVYSQRFTSIDRANEEISAFAKELGYDVP